MTNDQPTRRFHLRFSLRQLFLAVALVAVGLWGWNWLFRKEVVVRAAPPAGKVLGDESVKSQRNTVFVTGSFTKGTRVMVSAHIVQAGTIERASDDVFGRDEKANGGPLWQHMNVHLSLCERNVLGRDQTDLMTTWNTNRDNEAWQARVKTLKHSINVIARETLPGTITPGHPHIVYVEGDQKINVDGKVSVEEFAKANPGNYLVVTVEVR